MIRILLVFCLVAFHTLDLFAQGTNCSNAITIPLDGTCNTYNTSTTTGGTVHCTGQGYGGNGRVTYFKFTTNSSGDCVLMDISTSTPGVHTEVGFYTGCSGTTATGLQNVHSICFDDGNGLWAPNLEYGSILGNNPLPNTTYYLRIRTENGFTGTLRICAKNEIATNNLCSGSTGIDTLSTITQNNACNKGSTEVVPANLCAGTLENTAWYTYTVLTSGVSSIVISNLYCDNANVNTFIAGPSPNDYGFQIGFFTGNCGSLTSTNCVGQTGSAGGTIIATSSSLPAGTIVHVAIDGYYGSNCKYDILAINAVPLSVKLKYFEGWKADQYNLLSWITLTETNNDYFEIERSEDAINFSVIGKIPGSGNSSVEKKYLFKDEKPGRIGYYRLRQVDVHGVVTYSRIIRIVRETLPLTFNITFPNPVSDVLKLSIETAEPGSAQFNIMDPGGKNYIYRNIRLQKGITNENLLISKLAPGTYFLVVTSESIKKTYQFVKY